MYQKFCNSLPYYRQEKDWEQYGASITRATMTNWVIRNSEAFFHPMYKYFHRKLLERGFVMADETPLQVLHEAGRRAHIRRYLTDAVPQGKKLDYNQPAVQGILYIDKLFRLEENIPPSMLSERPVSKKRSQ